MLLPSERLYADLSEASDGAQLNGLESDRENILANHLLHEADFLPRYERLGNETSNGRQTVKYRVTPASTNAANGNERLIWVDEVLGMPVKTELVQREGVRTSRVLMQLTDIHTEVAATQFETPRDYRKVRASDIFALIESTAATMRGQKPEK